MEECTVYVWTALMQKIQLSGFSALYCLSWVERSKEEEIFTLFLIVIYCRPFGCLKRIDDREQKQTGFFSPLLFFLPFCTYVSQHIYIRSSYVLIAFRNFLLWEQNVTSHHIYLSFFPRLLLPFPPPPLHIVSPIHISWKRGKNRTKPKQTTIYITNSPIPSTNRNRATSRREKASTLLS